ncbi:MAG: hypothetical protein HY290_23930, partial [Planctomycetia bacterium]|nr:hypothetical protein [Planctomycetia bacterium]
TAEVRAVTFSPDGLLAASGGDDATILVWDVKKGKRLRMLTGHKGPVTSVAFSPDGSLLVSAGVDGTVQVWDPQDEDERALRSLQCGGPINHLAWTPEGRHVVTAHAGGTICVWRLNAWTPTPATNSENDDLRIARWVLEMGGQVRVAVQQYAGYEPEVKKLDDLPKRPFHVTRVFFDDCPRVNNENLKTLIGLTHLRELILEDLTITDDALDVLAEFPELKLLSLSGSRKLTDDGMRRLARLTKLESLYVGYAQITDAGLESLDALTNLKELRAQQLNMSGTSLRHFPRLKILALGLSQITDSGLAPIAAMPDLQGVALNNTAISDAGLAPFAGLRNLEYLSLNECPNVSDAGLEHLKQVTSLKRLALQKTRITPSGRAAFAADHPDCVVE